MSRAVVLTGGIGSGKSTVATLLASWGAHVVDADQLAREVVAPGTPGLDEVVAEFGADVLDVGGALDRAVLADRVFGHADRLAALEAIVHPRVAELADQRLLECADALVIVYEVPLPGRTPALLSELDAAGTPLVVVVDAPDEVRRGRLADRGVSQAQVTVRMASQPTRQEWLRAADRVIDNGGDSDALERAVGELWRDLTGSEPVVGAGG